MGFGTAPDHTPIMFQPGLLASLWGGQVRKLGKHIGEGLDARHAAAIGNLIWATLRGLVVAAMVVPEPQDTRRERRALVDMITRYVDGVTVGIQ
jgi:hypothetical protein